MSRKFIVRAVPILISGLLCLPATLAQVVTATLTGSITDSSGASVPNASVKVTDNATGVVRSTRTSTETARSVFRRRAPVVREQRAWRS